MRGFRMEFDGGHCHRVGERGGGWGRGRGKGKVEGLISPVDTTLISPSNPACVDRTPEN
jgi:hypothetical protein